jgi:3-oxoadipate enol-lactonase
VIFCHALGTSRALWDAQVRALSAGWRTLSFDMRGHGDSDVARDGDYSFSALAADIVALMDHVGAAAASVVGISVGGEIAQTLAALHPGRIEKLLLTSTACVTGAERAHLWDQRIAEVERSGMALMAKAAVQRWFTPEFQASHTDTIDAWERIVARTSTAGYIGIARTIQAMDLRPLLGSITCPTLVLAGDRDPATGPILAREIALHIAGARIRIVAGAGHLWNLEMPDQFNAALVSWLDDR